MYKKLTNEEYCQKLLEENGPLLGSELNDYLQDELNISAAYARKVIQRATAKGLIQSTKPVAFRHGQFLYYLQHQNISDVLPVVLKQQRNGLNRVFSSILHNNGEILRDEAIKIAASITNSNFFPRNEMLDKTLNDLKQLEIINNEEIYNHVSFLKASTRYFTNRKINYGSYRRHMINRLFTLDAIKWLEQINLLSWNQCQVFGTNQKRIDFNGHLWDAVGFTYLYGHYETKFENNQLTKIPSFVFIESIFHRQTYLEDVEGFVSRIEMQSARMKNFATGSRITPVLFYSFMNKEAFEYAKSKGLMMINSRGWLGEYALDLFGFLSIPQSNDMTKTCDDYIQLLSNRSFYQSHLVYELLVIKHSHHFITMGWKNQRQVHYEYNHDLYYFDWIMFDSNDTPHICTVLLEDKFKEQKITSFMDTEYQNFKKIYHHYFNNNKDQEVKWMVFDKNGQIIFQ